MPEMPRSISIVSQLTVHSELAEILAGLPIEVRTHGITLRQNATVNEISLIYDRISLYMQTSRAAAMCAIGDFWNYLHSQSMQPHRMEWLKSKQEKLTDEQYKRFIKIMRDAGYTARRWVEKDRDFKRYSWAHMRNHAPGVPRATETARRPMQVELIETVYAEEYTLMRFRSATGIITEWRKQVEVETD